MVISSIIQRVKYTSLLTIISYFILFIFLSFLAVLTISYLVASPPDSPSTRITPHFVLSVKPILLDKTMQAQIFVSSIQSLERDQTKYIARLVVVDPQGNSYSKEITSHFSKFIFPEEFGISSSNVSNGNYTVILLSGPGNATQTSLRFYVVPNAFLYYVGNFVFGKGGAITIGIIAVIVTFLFQVLSQHNQDRTRRTEDKAKWMIENSRYYLKLSRASKQICNDFSREKKNPSSKDLIDNAFPTNYCSENILINIIKFYRDYTEFETKTNIYYFDDMDTEIFVDYVNGNILILIEQMICDDCNSLNQFFDLTRNDLKSNHNFCQYLKNADKWLGDRENQYDLYKIHFVFWWVLNISVNYATLVDYSSQYKMIVGYRSWIMPYKAYLLEIIKDIKKHYREQNNSELNYELPLG
jgi:hypothetical protein